MENPNTDFCGYSVPHPYVPKMNVRLQTKSTISTANQNQNQNQTSISALTVLKSSFHEMNELCDVLTNTFDQSLEKFNNNKQMKKK